MGTISSGVGLISGLDINAIVGKLVQFDQRPADLLKQRIELNTTIQTTLQSLSLSLVGAKLAAAKLSGSQSFVARKAASSSEAISATAGPKATLGSFTFTPRSLVSTHQLLAAGFSSQSDLVGAGAVKLAQGGFVDRDTRLNTLNGGQGVRVGSIQVIDAAGGASVVDLTGAVTAADVVQAINSSSGANVTARTSGDRFVLVDNSGGLGTLQVKEVAGGHTATDLGLLSLTQSGSTFTGSDVLNVAAGLSLNVLNDGNGVRTVQGLSDFRITLDTLTLDVSLTGAKSVGDALNAINNHAGNIGGRVRAEAFGNGIRLVDTVGTADFTVSALNASKAAIDLGIIGAGAGGTLTGRNVLGGLSTVLISNIAGGSGATAGTIAINGTNVDLSAATTLADVVAGINAAGIAGVSAAINGAKSGIVISKTTAGALDITDVSGNLATKLGIAVAAASGKTTVNGGDLNVRYVSENTRLENYNGGVPKGRFRILDAAGGSATIDLTQDSDQTLADVINDINSRGLALTAKINDTGDGLLLERTGGSGEVQVIEEDNGSTAKALKIVGTSTGGRIDGSLAVRISLTATDRLSDVVTKIQTSGNLALATILNDGSSIAPFRLSLTSGKSGLAGRLLIDPGTTSLAFTDVSRPKDSVLLYGSGGAGIEPVQLTSTSNSFGNVIPGVTLSVNQVSASPVTVTVSQDDEAIVDAAKGLADAYNAVRKIIVENSKFDAETGAKGTLFNESAARLASARLSGFFSGLITATGSSIRDLGELGFSLDDTGQLQFDDADFRSALQANPNTVQTFFAATNVGFVAQFDDLIEELTDATDGLLTGRTDSLAATIEKQNRNLDQLTSRIALKRDRLTQQFITLELNLSKLQSQQSVLQSLATLAATPGSAFNPTR